MKITVVQSGGFTGISLPPRTLKTNEAAILSLVKDVFATWNDETLHGMDMLAYSITIDDGTTSHLLQFKDRLLPLKVQELVDTVMRSE